MIGGGVAGITAAHLLQRTCEVTLHERAPSLGGHAHATTIDNGEDPPFEVDTAFLIFNTRSYPRFIRFLEELGLSGRAHDVEMSLSVYDRSSGFYYAADRGLGALFAQRRLLGARWYWKLLLEMFHFRRTALREAVEGRVEDLSLAQFLRARGYSEAFARHFIYPVGAAVWSQPSDRIGEFPARSFFRFIGNHFANQRAGAQWRSIEGSSARYVRAFAERFQGRIAVRSDVRRAQRTDRGVQLELGSGERLGYDAVVFATHADQALALLDAASEDEARLLGAWRYQDNEVLLHSDASLMPPDRRVWSSWNVSSRSSGDGVLHGGTVTYYLNRVQRLPTRRDYFISLGDERVAPAAVVERFHYRHPVMTEQAMRTQVELPTLNGHRRSFFCGSYFGYGFHEDAIESAHAAAARVEQELSAAAGKETWLATGSG